MKKYRMAIAAALAVEVIITVVGDLIHTGIRFLAGWWSYMAFYAVPRD
jgi:hypothetical protein